GAGDARSAAPASNVCLPMGQTAHERLREYLAQLPANAQALLMREFERAIAQGSDVAVATLVLEQLRKVARPQAKATLQAEKATLQADTAAPQPDEAARPARDDRRQSGDGLRRLFRPLEPFLADTNGAVRPGQIRRASLLPVWQWLGRDGAPDKVRDYE